MKKLRYAIEAVLLHAVFFIFRLLPLDTASATGGWIGRTIGSRLAASRKALNNLRLALPSKTEGEYNAIVRGMWENLGRVIAEYPHLERIGRERVTFADPQAIRDIGNAEAGGVMITAHMANWEVPGASLLLQFGLPVDMVVRTPNNPAAARLLDKARTLNGRLKTIAKSKTGARRIVESLKNKGIVAILIDQKYNEGIPVPFFRRPAMTSTAFVQLCQKFRCPLVVGRVERLNGAHFRISTAPPPSLFDESGTPRPVEQVISETHKIFEDWIRERPEQWLWLHRRWRG